MPVIMGDTFLLRTLLGTDETETSNTQEQPAGGGAAGDGGAGGSEGGPPSTSTEGAADGGGAGNAAQERAQEIMSDIGNKIAEQLHKIPIPMWAVVVIAIVAGLLLLCFCICICKKCCCKKRKKKNEKKGLKGQVDLKAVQMLGNSYKEKNNCTDMKNIRNIMRLLRHMAEGGALFVTSKELPVCNKI